MKLRQNKNEEIDLRTIADTELSNQINSMLPLDGSKKMTGVLETVGGDRTKEQIKISDLAKVWYDSQLERVFTSINVYTTDNGISWKRIKDGTASLLIISTGDGNTAPYYAYAKPGLADSEIIWVSGFLLTDQTGVKKSGDTMTGSLGVSNLYVKAAALSQLDISIHDAYGAGFMCVPNSDDYNNSFGVLLRTDMPDYRKLLYRKITNGNAVDYAIYGEHSPPYTVGNYTGTGGSQNRIVEIGFSSAFAFIFPSLDMHDVTAGSSATNGFAVASDRNVSGKLYFYIAFKNM